MIELKQVHKRFGQVHAVRGISFRIEPGQIVGVLGPNGAGKSTTIRMITGSMPPTSGRVSVDGLDAVDDSLEVRQRLGYLPEANPLYPEMTVTGYLRYRAGLFGVPRSHRTAAISKVIDRCWLAEVTDRRLAHLSKGFRQRVGLAAALIHDPPVLILDEPTNGLDPSQIAETRSLIRDLAGDRTMLLVSHILPEVERTCDRIIIFAWGEIRADGSPEHLLSRGRATIVLEANSPTPDALVSALRALPGVSGIETTSLDDGWVRATIEGKSRETDLREPIARACRDANLLVRELRPAKESLESLYLRLVQGEPGSTGKSKPGATP